MKQNLTFKTCFVLVLFIGTINSSFSQEEAGSEKKSKERVITSPDNSAKGDPNAPPGGDPTTPPSGGEPGTSVWSSNSSGAYYMGKVGIGTSTPATQLHVNGSIRGNQSGALRINTGNGYVDIGPKNTSWAHIYTDRSRFIFNKEIRVNSGLIGSYDEDLKLRTVGSTKMTISKNGSVAIGKTPNDAILRVYKSETPYFQLESSISSLQIGIATCEWCFSDYAQIGDVVFRPLGEINNHHGMIFAMPNDNNDGNSYIKFGDGYNGLWMAIQNDRTVRIDGKVFAKEIEVLPNVWADHVFSKEYQLKSLHDVEKYIHENKHLEGIPSEKEVLENGIDMAKMDALLLEKIEELTLYLIEQNNEINNLKTENQELKQLILQN